MFISTTTLTSSPSDLTAVGQKQEACSSIGLLARQPPLDRPLTTPSSATLSLAIRQPNWSEADTLFPYLFHGRRYATAEHALRASDIRRRPSESSSDGHGLSPYRRQIFRPYPLRSVRRSATDLAPCAACAC